jgi:hypothetical protein
MDGYPWFKVVAADLLASEQFCLWSMEERGAYLTLMCMAWKEGSIPSSYSDLAKLVRLDASDMNRLLSGIRSRFNPHPTDPSRLIAPELDAQRDANKVLSDKRAKAGKAGADGRWHPDGKRIPLPLANGCQTDANQNQSQSQSKEEEETTSPAPSAPGPVFMELPIKGGSYQLGTNVVDTLRKAYPDKDVDAELKKVKAWLLTNPTRLKTATGLPRFPQRLDGKAASLLNRCCF